MHIRIKFIPAILASICLGGYAVAQTPTFAAPRARILQSIDEARTVTLVGNVHPLVAAASASKPADLGTPMEHMVLYLKGDAAQEANLEQLIAQQNDPKSPLYHHFLTPQAFGSQFGVATADIGKVTTWLQSHGFTVDEVPAGNRAVVFSGTSAQVAGAFKTEIRQYTIAGVSHYSNSSDPQIPAALASAVGGVVKLNDFRHTANISKHTVVPAAQLVNPLFTYGSGHYLAPSDYGIIYDINPLYAAGINGSGQTIAVLARSNIYMTDVQSFRSFAGLKANNPTIVVTNNDPGVLQGDSVETTLDVEWSGAVAPNATVKVIVAASTNTADGIDLSALYAVNNNVAPIVSLSYGSCEAGMGSSGLAFYNALWQQAAAQGMSVFVSSGDSGAAGCDYGSVAYYGQNINGLCSSPYATCVGGTEFAEGGNPGQYWLPGNNSTNGSAISYIPETVWNESGSNGGSGLWASGGGASIAYAKPSWQTGPGVPADGKRDVPDISLSASGHDGYLIWLYGGLNSVGGTSAAAPSFAGMMALVDQKANARQGLANTILYPLAVRQSTGGAAIFHDITTGNNSVPGAVGFSATTGFDRATGLGSVDANLLVNHWADGSTVATLSLSASATSLTVNVGQSTQTTLTAAASAALKSAVTLTVAGAPAGVTATFAASTIASPGSGTDVLNFAAASSATPGTYSLTVTATGGGQTAKLTVTLLITKPAFTLAASATSLSVTAGATGQVTVSTTPKNGFNSTITFSVAGLPAGVTAAFSPATVTGIAGGSSTLKLTAASSASAGTYSLTISGISGLETEKATVSLVIVKPTFKLSASAASVTLGAGKTGQIAISTTPQNGFSSVLTLSVAGLPVGITASFSTTTLTGTAPGASTLTLMAGSTAKAGSYTLTLTATGGGVTQTSSVTLVVTVPASCTLAANPATVTLSAGQAGSLQVSCGSVQGAFSGPLALSLSGAPSGVTIQTAASTLTAGSTTAVNISSALSATAGRYSVSLTASGSGFSQTVAVPLTVTAPNTFTVTAAQSGISAKVGTTVQLNVNSLHYGIFNSPVSFTFAGLPVGVTGALSTTALAAPGDGTVIATFAVASTAKAGTYSIAVTGTGGGQTESAPLTLTIAASQDFSFAVNVTALTIPQGGKNTVIVSTGNFTGGFNSTITLGFSGLAQGMNYGSTGATTGNNLVNVSIAFTATASTPVGTYPVTISASGAGGILHSAVVQMTVTKPTGQTK